jgi:hypothetical protein
MPRPSLRALNRRSTAAGRFLGVQGQRRR